MAGQAERFIGKEKEIKDATDDIAAIAKEAYEEWAEAYTQAALVLSQGPTIESAVSGADKLFDELFGLQRIASRNEAAFDALGEALKENGYQFDLNTDKGRANQQVLEGLAQSLVPQIAASYAEAGGSFQAVRPASMEAVKLGVFAQSAGGDRMLTDDQIRDVDRPARRSSTAPSTPPVRVVGHGGRREQVGDPAAHARLVESGAGHREEHRPARVGRGSAGRLNAVRIAIGQDPIVLPTEIDRVGLERATANAVSAARTYARNNPAVIASSVNPKPTGAAEPAAKRRAT